MGISDGRCCRSFSDQLLITTYCRYCKCRWWSNMDVTRPICVNYSFGYEDSLFTNPKPVYFTQWHSYVKQHRLKKQFNIRYRKPATDVVCDRNKEPEWFRVTVSHCYTKWKSMDHINTDT